MRSHEPEAWVSVRRMPPGRRQWVFDNTLPRLPAGEERLRALCSEGVAAERELLRLMLGFKSAQTASDPNRVWPREVVDLDTALDRRLGGLHQMFRVLQTVLDDQAQIERLAALTQTVFPTGATYYTAQPYIEEASRVRTLLDELGHERWQAVTGESTIKAAIAAVAAAHAPYAQAVAKFEDTTHTTWDEVKVMDLANHRRLCELVAGIVVSLRDDDGARKAALSPVTIQDQEVYELLKIRRRVIDIDPTTGQPSDSPSESGASTVAEPPPT